MLAASPPDPPEDPLRQAIRRVRGGDVASPQLRARIELQMDQALAKMEAQERLELPARRSIHPIARWASIAAVFAITVGGAALYLHHRHEQAEREEYLQANQDLLSAMVAFHQTGPAPADTVQVLSIDQDPASLRTALAQHLQRRVPHPRIDNGQWKLTQAKVCPFCSMKCACLEFKQSDRRITLLSVPASGFKGAEDGETYETTVKDHPIAGFVAGDSLHCLIGDSSIPLADIVHLRDQMRRL